MTLHRFVFMAGRSERPRHTSRATTYYSIVAILIMLVVTIGCNKLDSKGSATLDTAGNQTTADTIQGDGLLPDLSDGGMPDTETPDTALDIAPLDAIDDIPPPDAVDLLDTPTDTAPTDSDGSLLDTAPDDTNGDGSTPDTAPEDVDQEVGDQDGLMGDVSADGGAEVVGECATDDDCGALYPSVGACLQVRCLGEPAACVVEARPDGIPCDDGNPCTTDDACSLGTCQGVAACQCLVAADCEDEAAQDPCHGTYHCVDTVCTPDPAATTDCDDGDPCTEDSCDSSAGGCVHTIAVGPCDDGDPCTVDDTCSPDGACAGTPKVPLSQSLGGCDDGDPCTEAACDEATGACTTSFTTTSCDDGDPCTSSDACDGAGTCAGTPREQLPLAVGGCADDDPCTDHTCDPATGACAISFGTAPCDDGDPCTTSDACDGDGACFGVDKRTLSVEAGGCDDGEPCTQHTCDQATGECGTTILVGTCDDGDPCTIDDTCDASGACVGMDKLSTAVADGGCHDDNPCTTVLCDAATGACTYSYASGTCDDGDPCTVDDTCYLGDCYGTDKTTVDEADGGCFDGIVCTTDLCDPATGGCTHGDDYTHNEKSCSDGDPCMVNSICTDNSGTTDYGCFGVQVPNCCHTDADCAGGSPCAVASCDTSLNHCVDGPSAACDDGSDCTVDLCDPDQGGACSTTPAQGLVVIYHADFSAGVDGDGKPISYDEGFRVETTSNPGIYKQAEYTMWHMEPFYGTHDAPTLYAGLNHHGMGAGCPTELDEDICSYSTSDGYDFTTTATSPPFEIPPPELATGVVLTIGLMGSVVEEETLRVTLLYGDGFATSTDLWVVDPFDSGDTPTYTPLPIDTTTISGQAKLVLDFTSAYPPYSGAPDGVFVSAITLAATYEVDPSCTCLLSESFAGSPSTWTAEDPWHMSGATPSTCGQSVQDPSEDHTPTGDNALAGVVIGGCLEPDTYPDAACLTSPIITLGGSDDLTLSYWYVLDPSGFGSVEVAADPYFPTWDVIWSTGSPTSDTGWTKMEHDLSAYATGGAIQVRWCYQYLVKDTFASWSVDDVKVGRSGCVATWE